MGSIRVRMAGTNEWKQLQRRLREASDGRELRKELNREIEQAAIPATADVRASVRGVDVQSASGGGGSTGLRARIAAAVEVRALGSGVRIRVNGRKVDPQYGRTLARLMNDTGGRPWIHPLFGNPEHQHTQKGRDYFASAIRPHEPAFRAAIREAMDTIADKIRG